MKDLINWLRTIEHLAGNLYLQAAAVYKDDIRFKNFLENNAEDEAWHFHVMGSAAVFLASEPDFSPAISIDNETNKKIVNYFNDMQKGIKEKTISKDELLEKIVEAELSEWNDIFLYVLNYLKEKTSEFRYPAARIQAHIKEIEYYLGTVENRPDILRKITELPPVWIENILIVDDEPMITDLIKALLNRTGNIDIAHNGQEALKLIENKFYKLIISDIDMPVMDGLTLYKEVVKKLPESSNRFLFMTGDSSRERQEILKEMHVKYLSKPIKINLFRAEASKIILSK